MAQQIVIDIVAETKKLTDGFNEIDKEVKGVSGKLKGLTSAATAAASAFVLKQGVTFLKQGIEEAKDAKIAMQQATTTFGEGSKALQKITADAEKFGKELAVDNDELIILATQLGSRLPDDIKASSVELVKIFKDVEAFTGGAVAAEAASGKLAKAFADGKLKAGELQKIFPGLKQATYEQAEALSAAGKNQEALNLLLTEGANKYGDAAAKNVTATQKFDTALANFKETLGTQVLPILEKALGFLTGLLEAFDKQPDWLKNFELGLLALVGIGGPLLSFVANLQTSLTTLGLIPAGASAAAIGLNVLKVALAGLGIGLIIAAIVLLIQNWDDLSAKAKEVGEKVGKFIGDMVKEVKDFLGDAVKWIKDNWPLILGILTGPFGLFLVWASKYKEDIVDKFKEVWEAVKTAVTEKVASIIAVVQLLWESLKESIGNLFKKGKDTLFSIIEDGWNAVKDTVLNILDFLIIDIAKKWIEIGTVIVTNISQIVKGVIDKFTEMKDKAVEQFNKLKDSASKIWDNIKEFITDVATKIKNKLDTVYNDMVQVGKDIANGIIAGLFQIQGVFRTQLAKWVKDNIPDWIKKVLQISSPSKVMMQIGGNISEGLYMGMGLPGKPGINLPSINVGGNGMGGNVTININAGAGTDPYSVGRAVQQALNRYTTISK